MRIIFLGTAGSTPTKFRGLPSIAIEHGSDIFLFDCGEGTQRQMMQFSVNISKIKAVLLTHTHGDHTLGLPGLVRTMALNKRTAPLDVFIPKGGERSIRELINFDNAALNYRINVKPIKSGELYKGRDFTISAFKLLHTASTYGFVFKENDKLRFITEKTKKMNIKGETFSELLKKRSIKVGNRLVKLSDVTYSKKGRKIVYATDTRPVAETLKASTGADILIHESTYSNDEKELAKERYHSTAVESAQIARRAKVKRLIMIHPSARYKNPDKLNKEARKIFKNAQVANDGLVINL